VLQGCCKGAADDKELSTGCAAEYSSVQYAAVNSFVMTVVCSWLAAAAAAAACCVCACWQLCAASTACLYICLHDFLTALAVLCLAGLDSTGSLVPCRPCNTETTA
jgi:hypothetical protein